MLACTAMLLALGFSAAAGAGQVTPPTPVRSQAPVPNDAFRDAVRQQQLRDQAPDRIPPHGCNLAPNKRTESKRQSWSFRSRSIFSDSAMWYHRRTGTGEWP